MAVTLKDIAKKVGVSPTTVSIVMKPGSDSSRISDATKQKILDTARELGYQANKPLQIQSPVPGIPPSIGFVITDIENPFFTKLASVVEDVASRFGYNIIFCNTRENLKRESEFLEVLWRRKVDGLIIAPVEDNDSNLDDFLKSDIPIVFIDRIVTGTAVSAVLVDNTAGTRKALEYLIGLGHTRIGMIAGRKHVTTSRERLDGYIQTLKEHHVEIDESLVCYGDYTVAGGKHATAHLLDLPHPPSAIFSSGGVMSIGILQEIREKNLKVPEDLSFVGFDDEIWCSFIDPPLTVVAQPVQEVGREAAQLVIQLIQGWAKGEVQKIVLQPELIIRESCIRYKA